ncbi:M-protein, striated muscle-like [Oreochromis aureus]|uniref:M-protein, striated muscle-like n=1 Tax=Oreochromis aureus TaxID=47969 RepID=UPI001952FECF|nr:M-protein, striated muscle-like [Oreochromis aureus]
MDTSELTLTAANGTNMPYLGWVETTFQLVSGTEQTEKLTIPMLGKPNLARETHRGTTHRGSQVTGLEVGTTYVFRVRAVNAAGVVMASMASDPVTAKAVAGSQEVSCVVDEKSGDIVLSFESCQINEGSKFIWKKDYKEITDF